MHVALDVEKALLSTANVQPPFALEVSVAVARGERIEFPPMSEGLKTSAMSEEFERRVKLAEDLIPHLLCSERERRTFLEEAGLSPIMLQNLNVSGTPRMAALTTSRFVGRYTDATENLRSKLDHN